jgi:DnaJ-like protein
MATEFADLQGHDAYSLLGVPPDATSEQIQRSYRRLIKSVHPDLNSDDDDVTGHAALLNAARKVLLTRRVAYDEFRRRPVAQPAAEPPPKPAEPATPATPAEPVEPPESFPYVVRQPVRRRPAPVQSSSGRKASPRRKPRRRIRVMPLLLAILAIGAAITFFVRNADTEPDPVPSVAVPTKLAGTWKGTLKNPADKADKGVPIELTLTAGKTNGKVHYATGDGCDGAAVPTTTWKQALVFDTAFDQDGCDLGNLYVTSTSSTKVAVELHEQDKTLTGTLTKSAN